MPVKYYCPKCDRRFVDWGAEKLGYKCPDCEDKVLIRLGQQEEQPAPAPPRLSRRPKRPDKPVVDDDIESIDGEEEFEEEEGLAESDDIELADDTDEAAIPVVADNDTETGDEVEVEGEGDEELGEIDDDGDVPADLDFDGDGATTIEEFDV